MLDKIKMSLDTFVSYFLKDIVEPLNSNKVKIMLIQLLVNNILQGTTFINICANNPFILKQNCRIDDLPDFK